MIKKTIDERINKFKLGNFMIWGGYFGFLYFALFEVKTISELAFLLVGFAACILIFYGIILKEGSGK